MLCVNVQGELKRINRLVEFDDEVWWMLDYKLGDREDAACYRAQMQEYCAAMQRFMQARVALCVAVCGWALSEVK